MKVTHPALQDQLAYFVLKAVLLVVYDADAGYSTDTFQKFAPSSREYRMWIVLLRCSHRVECMSCIR